jgi:hypothetical protein
VSTPADDLCTCYAMRVPHRHVTAELPTQITDRPLPVLDFRPITSPYPVEFCWSCPKRTKRATVAIYRDGVYVKSLCDRHTESEHALAERMAAQ